MIRTFALCLVATATAACLAEPEPDDGGEPADVATASQAATGPRYTITSKLFKDLRVSVATAHAFACFNGWTYTTEYQLSYPVCVAPLPGHCTDTYRVVHKCIDGAFQGVSNTLVSHVCDYDYDGSSCEPIELPY